MSDTTTCKNHIAAKYGDASRDWKRLSKKEVNGCVVRLFQHTRTKRKCTVIFDGRLDYSCVDGDLFQNTNADGMMEALREVANTIRHCGDYCHLFYNQAKEHVWLTLGDGDGYTENGHTGFDEIEAKFKAIGIKKVFIEAEQDPDDDEGYSQVSGVTGITV